MDMQLLNWINSFRSINLEDITILQDIQVLDSSGPEGGK